jgi:CHRD domain
VVPLPEGETSGCTTIVDDLAAAISADPEDFYVNVHNAEFPAGAIRGQLK